MFNIAQRFQDVTGFMSTTACVMAVLISLISLLQLHLANYQSIPGEINIRGTQNVVRYSRSYGGKSGQGKENVRMKFDLQTDLRPLFNWNTKQVFVYLVGEYDGPEDHPEETSKVVIWDSILPDVSRAQLDIKGRKSKYSVYDVHPSLTNRTATVRLEFNVQPWVGAEVWGTIDAADEVTIHAPKDKA